jgi:mannosyltransferase
VSFAPGKVGDTFARRRHRSLSSRYAPWSVFIIAWTEVALSIVLGSIALGRQSFAYDESVTAAISRGGLRSIYETSRVAEPNMAGYFALMHFWRAIFGDSEIAFRSVSVLAIALTVVFVVGIGRRLFDDLTALVAGAVFAIAPFAVTMAQFARSYGLVVLLVTIATYLFVRAIESSRHWLWAAYAVTASLSMYMHFFAGLVVVAQVLSLIVLGGRAPWRRMSQAMLLIGVLILPQVWVTVASRGGAQWDVLASSPPITPRVIVDTVTSLGGGQPLSLVLGILVIAGLVVACATWRRKGRSIESWRVSLVAFWLVAPFLIALAFSVSVKPFFLDRYFIISLPAVALISASAMTRLRRSWAVALAMSLVALLAAAQLRQHYTATGVSWRENAAFVTSHSKPGDSVAFCPGFESNPYLYYALRYPRSKQLPVLAGNVRPDPKVEVFYEPRPIRAVATVRRVWVVGYAENRADWPSPTTRKTLCGLAPVLRGFVKRSDWTHGLIRALLFDRNHSHP